MGICTSSADAAKQIYAARPILISGSCKQESAEDHAKILSMVIQACKDCSDTIGATLFSIASDGESRRAKAFVEMTHQKPLSFASKLYPLLSQLPLFNRLVGEDDLVSDKDYKHIFKRIRSLVIRTQGIRMPEADISPSILRKHLLDSGLSQRRVDSYMNPDDKQDVTLAMNLLKAVFMLEEADPHSSKGIIEPGFLQQRNSIRLFGRLCFWITSPYTDVALSLVQQLEFLSAAAHLAAFLFASKGARSHFMQIPLFKDIQIMVKNVYFCIAKARSLDPHGCFYIIQLGTDRLETAFGILRTMIGNDCHADLLQMASRFSNITTVENILADRPQWSPGFRRLHLPAFDSSDPFSQKVDHLNPVLWKGNVRLKTVVLRTQWSAGRGLVEKLVPDAVAFFADLEKAKLDVMFPTGVTEDSEDVDLDVLIDEQAPPVASFKGKEVPVDLEDFVGAALANKGFDAAEFQTTISIPISANSGSSLRPTVHKARLLADYERYGNTKGSSDRLKRYADVHRHSITTKLPNENMIDGDGIGGSSDILDIGDPILTILQSDGLAFLAVGKVSAIKTNGRLNQSIDPGLLSESTVSIIFQVMQMTNIDAEERGKSVEDWKTTGKFEIGTYETGGRFVECMDPALLTTNPISPAWAFSTKYLLEAGAALFSSINGADRSKLPKARKSTTFPYSTRAHLKYSICSKVILTVCFNSSSE